MGGAGGADSQAIALTHHSKKLEQVGIGNAQPILGDIAASRNQVLVAADGFENAQ